jgi:hypothetical protein
MSVQRVRYTERQVLHTADLNHEQYYRMALRWRHQIAGHDWGIVFGLAVSAVTNGFQVQPGIAVDGFGRELILPAPLFFPWGSWGADKKQSLFEAVGFPSAPGPATTTSSSQADLWLLYCRVPADPACPPAHSRARASYDRWQETVFLRILAADSNLDPSNPPISGEDANSRPQDDPPADPAREWPIYLGRLQQSQTGGSSVAVQRRYARLRGASVTAADGLARMEISDDSKRTRFAIILPDGQGAFNDPKLQITDSGEMKVWGKTNLIPGKQPDKPGDLVLADRAEVMVEDLIDPENLIERLVAHSDPFSKAVWDKLSDETQKDLINFVAGQSSLTRDLKLKLAGDLSKVVAGAPLDDAAQRAAPILRPVLFSLRRQKTPGAPRASYNRLLMQKVYAGVIASIDSGRPPIWGIGFQPLPSVPAAAAPWQIYRVAVTQDGKKINQLRIELAHPGDKDDPLLYRFVLGHREEAGFVPCLTVQADGTVIMTGVRVDGQVLEGPIQAGINDPRFGTTPLQQPSRGVPSSDELTLAITFANLIPTYTITNKSAKILTCALYENVSQNQNTVRQGAVGSVFIISGRSELTPRPISASVPAGAVVSALVLGVDANGNFTQAEDSQKAP